MEEPVPISLPADEQIDLFYRHAYLAECNDAMAHMYGYGAAAELVGARLGDLLPQSDPANLEYLRAFVATGYRLTEAETNEVGRDGRPRYFVNNLFGIVQDGRLVRAWGSQRDVTERRLTLERLQQAQRMESVGKLAGGIAHEVNNMMSVVLGCSEFVLSRSDLPGRRARRRRAHARGGRALGRHHGPAPGVQPSADAAAACRSISTPSSATSSRSCAARSARPARWSCGSRRSAPVLADRGQLQQVLLNLASTRATPCHAAAASSVETAAVELGEGEAAEHPEVRLRRAATRCSR